MVWQLKRSEEIIRKEGFAAWYTAAKQYFKDKLGPTNVFSTGIPLEYFQYVTNFKKYEKKPFLPKPQKGKSFTVNWIIPSFGKGSGGHLNIFRYIKHLENAGHFNRIYIFGYTPFKSDEEAKRFLNKEFFHLNAEVYNSVEDIHDSDALFATSWETAYVVSSIGNTYKKFYFIQDFEPYFFPVGSQYLFAQQTYFLDFHKITVGPWIADHLQKTFGLKSDFIDFGYDPSIYGTKPPRDRSSNNHIFFYSRPVTARRCFELGIEALRELERRGVEFKLYTIGQEIHQYDIPFSYKSLGILTAAELAKLYSNCDLGLVFSPTNTSLLPYEMMASGCPVVELNSTSNRITFPNREIITLTNPDPSDIADSLEELLTNEEKRKTQLKKAYEYVKPFTWEKSAKKLEKILRRELET